MKYTDLRIGDIFYLNDSNTSAFFKVNRLTKSYAEFEAINKNEKITSYTDQQEYVCLMTPNIDSNVSSWSNRLVKNKKFKIKYDDQKHPYFQIKKYLFMRKYFNEPIKCYVLAN